MTNIRPLLHSLTLAVVALGAASFAASANARPPSSSPMLVSAAEAAPPAGFQAFCNRLPDQCAAPGRVASNRQPAEASRVRYDWRAAFNDDQMSHPQAATLGERAVLTKVADTAPSQGSYDWGRAFGGLPGSSQALLRPDKPVTLTPELWRELEVVTRDINRKIAPRTDQEAFGVDDFWGLPISEKLGGQGNCKHYVLEKRKALLEVGVPSQAMSIAVAKTPWGEIHAVLLIATDQGDYVLDNLSPWVKPWKETGYTWLNRQRPDSPTHWAVVASIQ